MSTSGGKANGHRSPMVTSRFGANSRKRSFELWLRNGLWRGFNRCWRRQSPSDPLRTLAIPINPVREIDYRRPVTTSPDYRDVFVRFLVADNPLLACRVPNDDPLINDCVIGEKSRRTTVRQDLDV